MATTGSNANPFRYGGKFGYYTDTYTGLQLACARWYSPNAFRWLGRDPNHYRGGDNLYSYVSGNPVTFVDPSGLDRIVNNSGHSIVVSGNAGGGHGSGWQVYGIIRSDSKIWEGPSKPVPASTFPYTPIAEFGPYIFERPPVGKIEDIDFYCSGTDMIKLRGDTAGPTTILGRNASGVVGVVKKKEVFGSYLRYLLRVLE